MAPDPTRVVADVDVLAADLLVGGVDRRALDALWQHTWTTLLASDALLTRTHTVIADLTNPSLADDWHDAIADWATMIDHPQTTSPALTCAVQGNAAHLLTHDETLLSASSAAELRRHRVSVKPPDAFHRLFDPATLYDHRFDDPYPGPDRDPRDPRAGETSTR